MSLINEALRKAQNQRTQTPGLGSESGMQTPAASYAGGPNRFGLMIGLGIFIVLLIALIAGLMFVLLSNDTSRGARLITTETEAPLQPTIQKQESASEEVSTAVSGTTESEMNTSLPTANKTETIEEPRKPPAEPNPEIMSWLTQSKITGIRITSSASKVILNNKAFVPGDSVNMSLNLKVFEIEPKTVHFIDSNGVKYVKQL